MRSHKNRRTYVILGVLILLTAALRVYISQEAEYPDFQAYFTIRQAEHIQETGLPIYEDELSYQGRTNLFAPLYYYFIAFLLSFLSIELVVSLVSGVLMALVPLLVYKIAKSMTQDKSASLLSAGFSGFLPALYNNSINDLSIYSFIIPLFLAGIYLLMNITKPRHLTYLMIVIVVLVFTHPIAYVFVLALVIYILLQKTEGFKVNRLDKELLLFFGFLTIWLNALIYKKAYLTHGLAVIWQNIPLNVLDQHFRQITFLESIYLVGLLPLIFGVYSAYDVFFKKKRKKHMLVTSIGISFFMLLLTRAISIDVGFIFLSLMLTLMASHSLSLLFNYIRRTKLSWFRRPALAFIIAVFIMTSVLQSINLGVEATEDSPTEKDIEVMQWLKKNTKGYETVLAKPEYGHLLNYYGLETVLDDNYLLVADAEERYAEYSGLMQQPFQTQALHILDKYNVMYIYFSERQDEKRPGFFDEENCFKPIIGDELYKVECTLN